MSCICDRDIAHLNKIQFYNNHATKCTHTYSHTNTHAHTQTLQLCGVTDSCPDALWQNGLLPFTSTSIFPRQVTPHRCHGNRAPAPQGRMLVGGRGRWRREPRQPAANQLFAVRVFAMVTDWSGCLGYQHFTHTMRSHSHAMMIL